MNGTSDPENPTCALRVVEPGLCTLVVDFGRPNSRSLGVPVGGAADRFALAIGNALVGNRPDAAALEFNLAGPTVEATGDLGCVVYGAPFELNRDGASVDAPWPGKTFTLHAGDRLRVGGTPTGVCAYLCVRGGLQVPSVLGSRSGLEPLVAGAELACFPGRVRARFLRHPFAWNREPRVLRALDGPQANWVRREDFFGQEYTVGPASNRMGLRLHGGPLRLPARELVSEPVCPGAVQVVGGGQCIILGVDGQTIGGYPKVAQVTSADLDKLGQLRPGERVRFSPVTLEEGEALYREKQAELGEWVLRLRTSMGAW